MGFVPGDSVLGYWGGMRGGSKNTSNSGRCFFAAEYDVSLYSLNLPARSFCFADWLCCPQIEGT